MDLFSFLAERATFVLAAAIIALAIVLERGIALFAVYPIRRKRGFFERLRVLVMSDQLVEAVALCNLHRSSPIAQLAREGLMRAHHPEEMVADGLKLVGIEARRQLRARTNALLLIAGVAILSGFVGAGLSLLEGLSHPVLPNTALAGALTSALSGIAVGIVSTISWGVLAGRTRVLESDVEEAELRVLDLFRARFHHSDEIKSPAVSRLNTAASRSPRQV